MRQTSCARPQACALFVAAVGLIAPSITTAHECALVISRDAETPPRLHVNGPSNYLNGDEAIGLLPGDAQFAGTWVIDAPGIATIAKDGLVRKRFRLRNGHRIALRLIAADAGFCMVDPSTWKTVLCKPGDTYPFFVNEDGDFGIQMASRTDRSLSCRATFQFVDLAGLHADSAPFTLRFAVDPLIVMGRAVAPGVARVRNGRFQLASYWALPVFMAAISAADRANGLALAPDGHMHGAPPKWVEPKSFKDCVSLFRAHLHDLDSEILAAKYSAAALRAPVMRRIAEALRWHAAAPDSGVPASQRVAVQRGASGVVLCCDRLAESARLSDPIGVREEQVRLAQSLKSWDRFIPPEFICPMRCEGERVYLKEIDCPDCGMALSDTRAHMDHRPKHGGTFFMASDNKHHLEGVLIDVPPSGRDSSAAQRTGPSPPRREFRVYIYDEFTQPLASDVVAARAVMSTPASDDAHKVELRPDARREFLSAPVPPSLNPVSIKLYVDFKNARGEQLFDFRF